MAVLPYAIKGQVAYRNIHYNKDYAEVIKEICGQKELFDKKYFPARYVILGSREYQAVIAYDLDHYHGKDIVENYNGMPSKIFDLRIIVIPTQEHFYNLFSMYEKSLRPNCPDKLVLVLPEAHDAITLAWGEKQTQEEEE